MALLDNLISYWSFDEASGNAIDSRGSNDLTDYNTVGATTGKVNGARQFVAANSERFKIADNADVSTGDIDFTFALWVQFTSISSEVPIIFKQNEDSPGNNIEYRLSLYLNKFRWFVSPNGSSGFAEVNSTETATTATWYFVVVWHDATANTLNVQVNNGTPTSTSHSTGVFNGASSLEFGAAVGGGVGYLNGLLDETGFWKRVLTADERTFLYNSGAGRSYAALSPPAITTTTLPNGSVAAAYSQTLAVTGGAVPITWSVVSGALPDGLTLNSSTGAISGTPTDVGSFSFTVRATDDNDLYDEQALSIEITAFVLPAGTFPSFAITGIRPRREQETAPDWLTITDSYEFEDGSKTFNEVASVAPIRWEYQVEINEATAAAAIASASLYHDFYNTVRHSQPFEFTDKFGTVWTDVRVESYERSHDSHKSWTIYINFVLVSFTGEHS